MAKYRAYRGRGHRGISVLVIFLLLLLAVVLYLFVLPEYLVYTEDGVRLEVPILGWGASASPSEDGGVQPSMRVDIVVDTPSPSPSELPSPTPTPSREPYSVDIPLKLLKDEASLIDIKNFAVAAGISDLVVEIKDVDGNRAEPEDIENALRILEDPQLTMTARISAFRDNTITREKGTFGVKHNDGVNWLDSNKSRWINPYIAEARQFVIDCVLDAKAAGFERVLMDYMGFPHNGSLSKINYGQNATISHISAMNTFLDELAEQTEGITLYAVVTEDTLSSGSHPEAGQDLTKFKQVFDKLYYYVPDDMSMLLNDGIPIFSAASDDLRGRLAQAEDTGYLVISGNGEFPLGAFER